MPGKAQTGGVDVLGMVYLAFLFAVIFVPLLLGRRTSPPGADESGSDDGPGGGPRRGPTPPGPRPGGIPLPDAEQAGVRLRDHGRLAERHRARERRPARHPEPSPARTPHRAKQP
jgi:hypothetical protein